MAPKPRQSSTPAAAGRTPPGALDRLTVISTIPGRNGTKADVSRARLDGLEVAVKDYRPRGWFVRRFLGPWLIAREARAYHAARGAAGLPALVGRLAPGVLAVEWFDATPLAGLDRGAVGRATLDRLAQIVTDLHERGIALGDLHHRDVLVARDGSVRVVDLATAWVLGDRPGPLRRAVFERARRLDLVALARMTARYTGMDERAAIEAAAGPAAARWYHRGRAMKRVLDRVRGRRR